MRETTQTGLFDEPADAERRAWYEARYPLMRTNGRGETAWGWGAQHVDNAPDGWTCECGWRQRPVKNPDSRKGRHHYPDGAIRCTPCARAYWEAA